MAEKKAKAVETLKAVVTAKAPKAASAQTALPPAGSAAHKALVLRGDIKE